MEKEFSPMEAFTCKVIFLKDERDGQQHQV